MTSDGRNHDFPESLELVCEPLTRTTLALYCGASGDHLPLHIDIDWVAANTDLPDVIGHGMLSMAYVGRVLTNEFPPERIKLLRTRFLAPTHVGDVITCTAGLVADPESDKAGDREYKLRATTQDGKVVIEGSAFVRT